MDKKVKYRRGQIAIWVIIAVMLVATIAIFFLIARKAVSPSGSFSDEQSPKAYIERCARDAIDEAVGIMLPQGGFVNPTNFIKKDEIKISYLCRNSGNYLPCINQHPMYLNEMKLEIKNYIRPKVEKCFVDLKEIYEKNRYAIDIGPMQIEISLAPNKVIADINRKVKISKNIEVQNYEDFKTEVVNPIYDLGLVAIEIASQEAKYCYFEYVGYMILFPRFSIEKEALTEGSKIYSIKDKQSGRELNFAARSCNIPPGL